jgi:hypothetical protein
MFRILFCGVLLLGSTIASASFVEINGQALGLGGPNTDSYYFNHTDDGVTSVSYDTGLLSTSRGTAQSYASADLAAGTLKIYGEATNQEVVHAGAALSDQLTFDLPDGVSEATVTFNLNVEGVLQGAYSVGSLGSLNLRFAGATLYATDSILLTDTTLPHTLTATGVVVEGQSYVIDANIWGSTQLHKTSETYGLFDIGNTAYLSIEMDPAVSFTSESGVFLSVSQVPIPAAAWLFGSALVGLVGVGRRKKAQV